LYEPAHGFLVGIVPETGAIVLAGEITVEVLATVSVEIWGAPETWAWFL